MYSAFHWPDWGLLYLDHLAISTPALEPTLAAYLSLPGSRLERGPAWNEVQRVRYAFVRLGEGMRIELLAGEVDSPLAGHLQRGGGPYHLCFAVAELGRALEQAAAEGARIVTGPVPDPAFDGRRIAFLTHPLHGLLELVEAYPSAQPPAPSPGGVAVATPFQGDRVRLERLLLECFPKLAVDEVEQAALDRTPGWDSLGHLQLMMALEQTFRIRIPAERLVQATHFAALLDLVQQP